MKKITNNNEKTKIYLIKTDIGCFISDTLVTSGYDYDYHSVCFKEWLFDGEKAEPSFCKNWMFIRKYPETIQIRNNEPINKRYELINPKITNEHFPLIVPIKEDGSHELSDNDIQYYSYEHDIEEKLTEVQCDIETIIEIENYELPPKIDFKAIYKHGFSDKIINVNNKVFEHQFMDKIIFPEIALHNRPCKISSRNLYTIVRQYIKDNIDTKVAKISSDYDFCFSVDKVVPLLEPISFSYNNLFARTKKEREKIHFSTKEFKTIQIFEMTDEQNKYKGYTPIEAIFANSEKELKEKVEEFLNELIDYINEPLELCEHCGGTGYKNKIEKFIK